MAGRFIIADFTRLDVEGWTATGALVAFGDNLQRYGRGGVATTCRGIRGTVGIPTKKRPARDPGAYLTDPDFDLVKPHIDKAFRVLILGLRQGCDVYWPSGGVGTGLAELPERAPRIWAYLEAHRERLAGLARHPDPTEGPTIP